MFSYMEELTKLDLTSFDTSQVTTMFCMFQGCSSLTSLNINFKGDNVLDTSFMFE